MLYFGGVRLSQLRYINKEIDLLSPDEDLSNEEIELDSVKTNSKNIHLNEEDKKDNLSN